MNAARATILVVEDNLINQKVAVALLSHMGYACDVAGDGRQALAALEQRRYDAVLMDCQMPVMDGYDATREIRRREGDVHVPIVAMTAAAMAADRERCLAVGMDDYLAKPIDQGLLASVLDRRIGAQRPPAAPAPFPSPEDGDSEDRDSEDRDSEDCDSEDFDSEDCDSDDFDSEDPLDVSVLTRLDDPDGNGELVEELIDVFRREVAPRVAELRAAFEHGELPRLAELAHGFKGTAATLGLRTLEPLFARVERAACDGAVAGLPPVLAEVESELGRALEALDRRR